MLKEIEKIWKQSDWAQVKYSFIVYQQADSETLRHEWDHRYLQDCHHSETGADEFTPEVCIR